MARCLACLISLLCFLSCIPQGENRVGDPPPTLSGSGDGAGGDSGGEEGCEMYGDCYKYDPESDPDSDGDGYTDEEEAAWGTDPQDPTDWPDEGDVPDGLFEADTGDDSLFGVGEVLEQAAVDALVAKLGKWGFSALTKTCVTPDPTVVKDAIPSDQGALNGEPFVYPDGQIEFKGLSLFTARGIGGISTGLYAVEAGVILLKPLHLVGCVELYSLDVLVQCVPYTCPTEPPTLSYKATPGTPGYVGSIIMRGIHTKTGLVVGTKTIAVRSPMTVVPCHPQFCADATVTEQPASRLATGVF